MEDNRLAAAAAGGDDEAFTRLVERYRSYIYTIAFKMTLHEDDALDVTQNVFMRLVEKIGSFRGRGTFRAWLATITVREASGFLRRPSRREASTNPQVLACLSDKDQENKPPDQREALDASQRRQLVEAAMAHLSPQQRAIFALRFKEDMGPKEIARRLGLPAGQVRSQLHWAIAKIRQAIAGKSVG